MKILKTASILCAFTLVLTNTPTKSPIKFDNPIHNQVSIVVINF